MNKKDLIERIAADADLSKAGAARALEAALAAITFTLKKGGTVTLVGFGTFSVAKRAGRMGSNPRTGAAIEIAARMMPKFTPGSNLRAAVNPISNTRIDTLMHDKK